MTFNSRLRVLLKTCITDRDKERKLRRIHDNRPAVPLPPAWSNAHHSTNFPEYQVLIEDVPQPASESHGPSAHLNQSSDAYAYLYEHMLGWFMELMTMMQRSNTDPGPTRPPPMAQDLIPPPPSDTRDGYLVPVSHSSYTSGVPTHASQLWESDGHYEELNHIWQTD